MANSVTVRYGSKGAKQVTSEADKLHSKLTNLQKQGAKGLVIGAGVAATNLAFNAVGLAISKVTGYLGDSAAAFREDQVSQQKLTTALRANIEGWEGSTDAIEERIKAGQKLGFSDESQRSAVAELAAAYGNEAEALDTLRVAQDLARFSGVDLATAADVLIKVHAGNFRALKQLGINTKGITTEQEALAAIMKIVAGQAEDYAGTLSGKLAVAEEKAGEASEKFGKSVAHLQAIVLPAVADAIDVVATGYEHLFDTVDRSTAAWEHFRSQGIEPTKEEFYEYLDATGTVIFEHERLNAKFGETGDAAEDLGDDLSGAQEDARRFASRLNQISQAASDAEKELDGLADTITDELFGDAITAGHEAELKQHIADLIEDRKEAKKGSAEYVILSGEIAEYRKQLFELHLEQAAEEGPEAAIAFLERERKKAGAARNEIDKMIQSYRILAEMQGTLGPIIRVQSGRYAGKDLGERAAGGPVKAGDPYVVGEKGPELFVPKSTGTVIPNGASSGGGSWGSTVVNINVSGVAMMTPGTTDQLGRLLEPVITRALQKRGQLGAARAF
jgi:hypothetical protein